MSEHLVFYGRSLVKDSTLMLEVGGKLYWPKRLKFWAWKKHRTMGRPILVKRGTYEY